MPTALVVTTVHWPDDTRIRERLIRSLAADFEVHYAARVPGPTDRSGLRWIPLRGGRASRNLTALRHCLFGSWDLLVLHDPELLPAGMLARLFRWKPVVFDVHENIPATAMTRSWVPGLLRRPLAALTRGLLRLAEKVLTVTLAEDGYAALFRSAHPVFSNHPDTSAYPDPLQSGDGSVVYLGDVTRDRGAAVAVEAARIHRRPMTFVGRVGEELREELEVLASDDVGVEFAGELPNPTALERIRRAGVGIAPLLDGPNYRESAPTKVLEYLAVGLPVVVSDMPGTRRLVEGLEAVVLVPPGDAEQLARGIEACLEPRMKAAAVAQVPSIRRERRWPGAEVAAFYRSLV